MPWKKLFKWSLRAVLAAGGLIVVIGIIGLLAVLIESRGVKQAPVTPIPQLQQDAALLADAQVLGINYSKLNLEFEASLKADDIPDSIEVVGVFIAPNTIHVKSGRSKKDELQTVAYEYMHYVWANTPPASRALTAQSLENFYNQSPELRANMQGFVAPQAELEDEMDSIVCTKLDPMTLPATFNAYCDASIPGRSVLFP